MLGKGWSTKKKHRKLSQDSSPEKFFPKTFSKYEDGNFRDSQQFILGTKSQDCWKFNSIYRSIFCTRDNILGIPKILSTSLLLKTSYTRSVYFSLYILQSYIQLAFVHSSSCEILWFSERDSLIRYTQATLVSYV